MHLKVSSQKELKALDQQLPFQAPPQTMALMILHPLATTMPWSSANFSPFQQWRGEKRLSLRGMVERPLGGSFEQAAAAHLRHLGIDSTRAGFEQLRTLVEPKTQRPQKELVDLGPVAIAPWALFQRAARRPFLGLTKEAMMQQMGTNWKKKRRRRRMEICYSVKCRNNFEGGTRSA